MSMALGQVHRLCWARVTEGAGPYHGLLKCSRASPHATESIDGKGAGRSDTPHQHCM